jgi:hypothetical protein
MVNTSSHFEVESTNTDETRSEFKAINFEMNKHLKSICPLIQSLIEKFKNEPESFETEKVRIMLIFELNKILTQYTRVFDFSLFVKVGYD